VERRRVSASRHRLRAAGEGAGRLLHTIRPGRHGAAERKRTRAHAGDRDRLSRLRSLRARRRGPLHGRVLDGERARRRQRALGRTLHDRRRSAHASRRSRSWAVNWRAIRICARVEKLANPVALTALARPASIAGRTSRSTGHSLSRPQSAAHAGVSRIAIASSASCAR
jgi:hypothetical protein